MFVIFVLSNIKFSIFELLKSSLLSNNFFNSTFDKSIVLISDPLKILFDSVKILNVELDKFKIFVFKQKNISSAEINELKFRLLRPIILSIVEL